MPTRPALRIQSPTRCLLERVGVETRDAGYASHWLSEAANVWSTTLGDAHRAARVLMQAIDRDPTQRVASDRLAQLYREKADYKALVALLERRTKALGSIAPQTPEIRGELAEMHEELGRLWNDELQQPKKAQENMRRAIELGDPVRQVGILREEIQAHREAGDLASATLAVARARELEPNDVALQQEYGSLIVERVAGGEPVSPEERAIGAGLLAGLAEMYDGEHGLAYSAGALDIEPGHDRAVQLYAFYAHALAREEDVGVRYLAYIDANPSGAMAGEARWLLAASYEAAGQADNAIQILEPLRAVGDPEATTKLADLYEQIGRSMPTVPPDRGARDPRQARTGERREGGERPRRGPGPRVRGEAPRGVQEVPRGARGRSGAPRGALVGAGLPANEARLRPPSRRAPGRDPRARRDGRGAARSAPRDRGAVREQPSRHRRRHRGVEAAPHHRPVRRDRASVPDSAPRAHAALGRPREPLRAGRERRDRSREEARAPEEAREHSRGQAQGHRRRRPRCGSASRTRPRKTSRPSRTASKMFTKAGHTRSGRAGHRGERAERHRSGRARRAPANAWASSTKSSTIRRAPATPTPTRRATGRRRGKLWEAAERCFVAAERWDRAGQAAVQRAELESDAKSQARHFARSADYLARGGDDAGALVNLVQASDLEPTNEEYAQQLADRYTASLRWDDLVQLLLKRADNASDAAKRAGLAPPGGRSLRQSARRQGRRARDVAEDPARGRRRRGGRAPRRRRDRARAITPRRPSSSSDSRRPRRRRRTRRASRYARPSSSPTPSATSRPRSPATSGSSRSSTRRAAWRSRRSPICRRRATTAPRRRTRSSASSRS